MSALLKMAAIAAAGISLTGLGACASPARPEAMVVAVAPSAVVQSGQPGYRQISIAQVAGGEETNPLWVSNVSNADFQAALEATLRSANYLSDGSGPLQLSVILEEVQQPFAGLDLTVTTRARYRLTDASGRVVFEEVVGATGTATMGDALMAVERLRMANENSVRANLESFLAQLRASLR